MPSRLSSLLARDGVVGVKMLERAFQRQVIYGGALDTNLLEMKAVAEEQLLQYASLATGVPPATRSDLERIDRAVGERVPEALARQHGVAPLAEESDGVRILVRDPIDLGGLEALAGELDMPVVPLLVLEYRFQIAMGRVYDLDVDSRFTKLAARLAREATPAAAVMRPESIVVTSPAHRRKAERPARRRSRRRPTSKPEPIVAEVTAGEAPSPARAASPEPEPAPPAGSPAPASAPAEPEAPQPSSDGLETGPLGPEDARLRLESAAHRDEVFTVLLRAMRSQTSYAALLTVQGGSAIGRVAIGAGADAEPVREVLVPLDVRSSFRHVIESGAPYIGPVSTGDAEVDAMITKLGGCVPPAGVLLPISLRSRVVAVAYGHRGTDPIAVSEVSGILPVAGAAADALHRLIMNRKSSGAAARAVPEPVPDDPPTQPVTAPHRDDAAPDHPATADTLPAERELERGQGGAPATATGADPAKTQAGMGAFGPSQAAATLAEAAEAAAEADPIEDMLLAVSRGDDEGIRRARERARAAPEATAAALANRFPGPLELDRHNLGGRLQPAPDHGPLLELVVALGGAASPLIVGELQSDEPAHRYYAALCAGAVQPPAALNALVNCLFDADPGVRAAAAQALASYPQRERDGALARVREVLTEIDEARVSAAADACAELGHAAAVPALVEALAHGTAPGPVRRALIALTKQDFGPSSRKWRSWWTKNRDRSRIEWMVDGLGHKDADVRRSSIEELRRLTGEYFGYHHDLPRKERSDAHKRWTRWLREMPPDKLAELDGERRSSVLVPAKPQK